MPAPWEKYSGGAQAAGPWAKYGGTPQSQNVTPEPPQAPRASLGQRLLDSINPVATAERGLALGSGAIAQPVSGIAGLVAGAIPGGKNAADMQASVQNAMTYSPRTAAGQRMMSDIGEGMGMVDRGADALASHVPGGPGAQAAAKTALLFAPNLLGLKGLRAAPGRALATTERAAAAAPKAAPAPTVTELMQMKNAAYKASEDAGVIINKSTMARIANEIKQEMAEAGIDKNLHPDSLAALQRVISAGKNHTTLKGADIVRQVISDAERSITPRDAQKAGMIKDSFDEKLDAALADPRSVIAGDPAAGLAALKDARGLYSRARKGADIEELFRRAELRAGANYTVAGYETALRQEFKSLAMNQRRFKRFTPEERNAITRVARGAPLENALRFVGKFAPSGNLSTAISAGTGFLVGGPAGAAALPAMGAAAKYGAGRMTGRNAARVSELVRRGPTGE